MATLATLEEVAGVEEEAVAKAAGSTALGRDRATGVVARVAVVASLGLVTVVVLLVVLAAAAAGQGTW